MRQDKRVISHVIGFDDFPFERNERGIVPVVGAVFAGLRLDGVITFTVERDGDDAARAIATAVSASKHRTPLHLVMLQGIALAGFNVVDVFELNRLLGIPVLVVARREPDFDAIRRALLAQVPNGAAKWAIIERLGAMERMHGIAVQRVAITPEEADAAIARFAVHGNVPEPLRVAHLIAGGVGGGESRGRV